MFKRKKSLKCGGDHGFVHNSITLGSKNLEFCLQDNTLLFYFKDTFLSFLISGYV